MYSGCSPQQSPGGFARQSPALNASPRVPLAHSRGGFIGEESSFVCQAQPHVVRSGSTPEIISLLGNNQQTAQGDTQVAAAQVPHSPCQAQHHWPWMFL